MCPPGDLHEGGDELWAEMITAGIQGTAGGKLDWEHAVDFFVTRKGLPRDELRQAWVAIDTDGEAWPQPNAPAQQAVAQVEPPPPRYQVTATSTGASSSPSFHRRQGRRRRRRRQVLCCSAYPCRDLMQ